MRGQELARLSKKAVRLIGDRRFSYLAYVANNRLRGLDFAYASHDDLGLATERGNYYSNGGGPYLARVVKTLDIPPGTNALDVGCGKGGAVLTLSRFPYQSVVGLDIVQDLIDVAEANARRVHATNIEFVCADAGAYEQLDRFGHMYMFNPFPAPVMDTFLSNVGESLRRSPRPLTVVYCNPIYHDAFIESGQFVLAREIRQRETFTYNIYEHRPAVDDA